MLAALALAPARRARSARSSFGWFCVRLSGVYLAMLTLAFAQIVWSIAFQWDSVTGGSNGLVGIWPPPWLARRARLLLVRARARGASRSRRSRGSRTRRFGYALRACRDSPLRAEAIGIDVRRRNGTAFALAGAFAGLAGGLYAFSKGSISPETLAIPRSVDALVMVLLGGLNALAGPLLGAAAFTWLSDTLARVTEYWRAVLGAVILRASCSRFRWASAARCHAADARTGGAEPMSRARRVLRVERPVQGVRRRRCGPRRFVLASRPVNSSR